MNNKVADAVLPTLKGDENYRKRLTSVRKFPLTAASMELRYRAILDQIPAVIYTESVGIFNQTVYINPQIEALTGCTPEEWIEDSLLWYKVIVPEDQKRVWEENIRTEETGEPYKVEYRIRSRDGQVKWVQDESWLIREDSGEPLFWQGYMIDITERKVAEMELEHRAAELSALQETVLNLTAPHSLPELLNLIVERAATLLNANNGMLYLVDKEAEKVNCVVSYNTQRDYTGTVLNFGEGAAGKVAQTGQPLIIKNYARWSGKSNVFENYEVPFQAMISAPMIWQGRVNGVLHIVRKEEFAQADLDQLSMFANHASVAVENARLYEAAGQELEERKRAEAALLDSVSIYRQAIESTGGVPYYQTNKEDGKSIHYDFIGEGIQQITGYEPELFNAKLWDSLVLESHPVADTSSHSAKNNNHKAKNGNNHFSTKKCEYRIKARDGKIHWVFDSAVILRDETGKANGSIGLYRDITETKRAEQVQQAIYRISQAVVTTASLDGLFRSIHQILGELMPVENFYIALYDLTQDLITFPYFVDQYDKPPLPAKPKRGMTEYVIRTGKPVWASERVFQQLLEQGEVESMGSDSVDWIGVPLRLEEHLTGVMVAQSYAEGVRYSQEDFDLMEFVSTQVAVCIERKRAEEALRLSLEDTRQYAERMALLNRVARAISTTLDLDTLLEIVYQEIIKAISSDSFFIALYDSHTSQLEFRIRVDGGVREQPDIRPLGNALIAKVVNSKDYILINDYDLEKDHLPPMAIWESGVPSRSWLGIPMLLGEEVIGVISVQSYRPNTFGERERELLSTIADTVAMAIENARLYQAEKQRTIRLTQIVEIGIELAPLRQEEDVLDTIVNRFVEVMNGAASTVMLIDSDKNEATIAAQTGLPVGIRKSHISLNLPVFENLLQSAEPLLVADIDQQAPAIREILARPDIKTFFAYPMVREGHVIGAITLSSLQSYNPRAEEVTACHLLAERAAAALENARLFEKTEHHLLQVQALRTIDSAIASSFDLRSILNIILYQIITQLNVDAADILLLNQNNFALEYTIGKGFLTKAIEKSRFLLGEGVIGHQIMERHTIHIPNLKAVMENLTREDIFKSEGFATYSAVPLIAKGEIKGVLEVFHRAPVDRGTDWLEFLETLAGQVAIAIDNSQLFSNLQRSNLELSQAYDATIEGWSRALDMRDSVTEGHTKRVTEKALTLARIMGMSAGDLVHMRRGILLHDIGKMAIPDTILQKEKDLTAEEWKIMRMHTDYAYEMLAPITYLRPALDIPGSHHEKWDGTGYPRGLKGEQIPLAARIFAVVDVFDALTTNRPYRKAWSKEKAVKYISDEKGKSFDPQVVDVFLSMKREMGLTLDSGLD